MTEAATRVVQLRVAGQLAQPGQRAEHLEALLLLVHVLLRQARNRGDPGVVVEAALRTGQGDELANLGARRKLGRHLVLGPSQDERPRDSRERGQALGVLVALDGRGEALAERLPAPEEARREHPEQAPQLAEVVLERRAAQRHAPVGLEVSRRARTPRRRVLDRLRLVHDQRGEAHLTELLRVQDEQPPAANQHVVRLERGQRRRAIALTERHHVQRRREARGLAPPVVADRAPMKF
jgi:hypothetical protein